MGLAGFNLRRREKAEREKLKQAEKIKKENNISKAKGK